MSLFNKTINRQIKIIEVGLSPSKKNLFLFALMKAL